MAKTILITGSTDGIGLATATALAQQGHNIILHGRSTERLQIASERVRRSTQKPVEIKTWQADFSKLSYLKTEAHEFGESLQHLDVVIHNAGTYETEREPTEWNLERTMTINHFAPFILTRSLLEPLKASSDGRVIIVSSIAHTRGHIDLRDLGFTRNYNAYAAYATSKLANLLFAYELADRFADSQLKVNALHPGVISTKLLAAGFNMSGDTVEKGAQTSVFLATAESLATTNGLYFVDKLVTKSSPESHNIELRKNFWNLCEQITGVHY